MHGSTFTPWGGAGALDRLLADAAEATRQRTNAAGQRAQALRQRAAATRHRGEAAGRRGGAGSQEPHHADERDRLGDQPGRQALLAHQRSERMRDQAAQTAERMAQQAAGLAAYLEERVAVSGADAARRTALAEAERAVADVLHRNAAKLRGGEWPCQLEPLPRLAPHRRPAEPL